MAHFTMQDIVRRLRDNGDDIAANTIIRGMQPTTQPLSCTEDLPHRDAFTPELRAKIEAVMTQLCAEAEVE